MFLKDEITFVDATYLIGLKMKSVNGETCVTLSSNPDCRLGIEIISPLVGTISIKSDQQQKYPDFVVIFCGENNLYFSIGNKTSEKKNGITA